MFYNYLIEVSYDGKDFFGFQKQLNQRSVQEEIENAITRLNKQRKVVIQASGRTDTKVHAYKQVCTFKSDIEFEKDKFLYNINNILPDDIFVYELKKVNCDFHPRYHAKSKHYQYRINIGSYNVFEKDYVLQLNKDIDIEKMKLAASLFVGKKDFRTFSSATAIQNTKREIFSITINKKNDIIVIDYYGSGFLRYMVRKITMILIDVGLNKITIEKINELLMKKDITAYSKIAGGQGLYLMDVNYLEEGYKDEIK